MQILAIDGLRSLVRKLTVMAFFYQLAIECGADHTAAMRIRSQFNRHNISLKETLGFWSVDLPEQDMSGYWWISVLTEINGKALEATSDEKLISSAGQCLYDKLKEITGYRFAIVGIEAYQFNRAESLQGLLGHQGLQGLVVSGEFYEQLGRPEDFVYFSPGYLWIPSKPLN